MNTPICDFVEKYNNSDSLRFHMPAHKGKSFLGFEGLDITEISGADSLFEAKGIIAESEKNASMLFGGNTFYSTEGSSLSIRTMLYLVKLWGSDPLIIAGRNAHKSFHSAVALLDLEVEWLYSSENYLSCGFDIGELEKLLASAKRKTAVYLTSPDYLGNVADIKAVSKLCKKYNALLLVDNAHGAYLKFLPESRHPLDMGADMCCDSAHKTLPVLTGGAYLHISKNAPEVFNVQAKNALSLFASTSPSYLILQSLDNANEYIAGGYSKKLAEFIKETEKAKEKLKSFGFELLGNEPLKIVISANKYGYFGDELAKILENSNIMCEFSHKEHIVFMLSPENKVEELEKLVFALCQIPKRNEIKFDIPKLGEPKRVLTPRQSIFAESEIVDAKSALGRILAEFNISCPPAVPILVCGEEIDEKVVACFGFYGVEKVRVIK